MSKFQAPRHSRNKQLFGTWITTRAYNCCIENGCLDMAQLRTCLLNHDALRWYNSGRVTWFELIEVAGLTKADVFRSDRP